MDGKNVLPDLVAKELYRELCLLRIDGGPVDKQSRWFVDCDVFLVLIDDGKRRISIGHHFAWCDPRESTADWNPNILISERM